MKHVAVYARVSSDRQAQEATIESQIVAIQELIEKDCHCLLPEDKFVDDGYTGSTLLRPALERIRDRAAEGTLDLLYVHSPDRLARKYAYQAVLLEELDRAGVEVVFVNFQSGETPEEQLLLQIQGVIAEYEGAKILERTRRGRLHKARRGSVNVLGNAPYGHLYVSKSDHQDARYEILEQEAEVVRRIFNWFVTDQLSIGEITRRLGELKIPTRTGLPHWNRSTVWQILRNPAHCGKACYGKTTSCPRQKMTRVARRSGREIPRRPKTSHRENPREGWIPIEVPAIISEELFTAAQEQLERNRQLKGRNVKQCQYLLRGLLVCSQCSYRLYGRPAVKGKRRGRSKRTYGYYRCTGTDGHRFEGGKVCDLRQFRTNELDEAVWSNVTELLREPRRVLAEFTRRTQDEGRELGLLHGQREMLLRAKTKAEAIRQRLMDAYEAGAIDLDELKPRMEQTRARAKSLDKQLRDVNTAISQAAELREVVTQLSEFEGRLDAGLDSMRFEERQQLVRLLVNRVEVNNETISIVYRVKPPPGGG